MTKHAAKITRMKQGKGKVADWDEMDAVQVRVQFQVQVQRQTQAQEQVQTDVTSSPSGLGHS